MNRIKKWLALLLVLTMVCSLAACGQSKDNTASNTEGDTSAGEKHTPTDDQALSVGYDKFAGEFSPFYAATIPDHDAVSMTTLTLLNSDRAGAVVYHGIDGETRAYHGTDDTYYGPADLTLTENPDGTVCYDFTLREDLVFSDGVPVTIDDVIFSLYVLCDPSYNGPAKLKECPIQGLAEYLQNRASLSALLAQLGEENTDFTDVTQEQQSAFWDAVNNGLVEFAQNVVDAQSSLRDEGESTAPFAVADAARLCGIEVADNATLKDFALALGDHYHWNFQAIDQWINHSNMPGVPNLTALIGAEVYGYSETNISLGTEVASISGIQKTGDYSLRVTADETDITTLYELGSVPIAPLHYYGSETLYDYENCSFGFPKGDLSSVKAVTERPLGAGPYQFVQCEDGAIHYKANPSYYLGEPKTERIVFYEASSSDFSWKEASLLDGSLDICYSSNGTALLNWFVEENGGTLTGDKYRVSQVASGQYTYLGMKPELLNVAGEPDSDASKSLRKAIGTIVSVCRAAVVDAFYNEEICLLDAPLSGASWAANEITTPAFSENVDGELIYTEDMTEQQRYEAASAAALGWLERAGYTVEGGTVTAAPEGGRLSFEVQINSFGVEIPYAEILHKAQEMLDGIGMELVIHDLHDEEDDNTFLPVAPGSCEMWVDFWVEGSMYPSTYEWQEWIRWSDTADPDAHLYEVYYSDMANGGANAGKYADVYHISPELDALILAARSTADQARRIELYRQCLDFISDMACELPLYQAQDSIVFSAERIAPETIPTDLTASYGWTREAHRIELK